MAMITAPLAPLPPGAGIGVVPPSVDSTHPGLAGSHPLRPDLLWPELFGPGRRPASPARRPAPPQRVRVAVLGIDAAVVPVDVDDAGALTVPADPAVVGWWRAGAWPGVAHGTVVLAGHVDTHADGPGALFRVAALRPGDRIEIDSAAGPVGYAVAGVRSYPKAELPPEVFATAGSPRLVLVTCGGAFDRRSRHYADNVVVYAVPAASRASREVP
jgi:hypothetical protein